MNPLGRPIFSVPYDGRAGANLAVYAGDGYNAVVNPLGAGVTPWQYPRPATPGVLYNRRYLMAGPDPYTSGGGIYSMDLSPEPFAAAGGGL